MIRLAHVSDIHFGGENTAAVAAVAARLAEQRVDLVIVSGDLTQFGEKGEFAAAAAWLRSLPFPVFVTPGNHDAPYLAWIERFFAPFARYEAAIGPAQPAPHLSPGLAVYGLNTARGVQPRANWSKGQISRRQADAAVAWFGQAPAEALPEGAAEAPAEGGKEAPKGKKGAKARPAPSVEVKKTRRKKAESETADAESEA